MRKQCIIAAMCSVIAVCILCFSGSFLQNKSDVLLFVIGGDLETENDAATQDIQEIIRATREQPGLSCTVFLCGSEKWGLANLQDGDCYTVRISSGKYKALRHLRRNNATTEKVFETFLKNGKEGCDLIIWGHGGSGSSGIGVNLLYDRDTLSLYEIQAALESAGRHFRVIGFDACSMATLQSAWVVSPYCDFFAASTEDESLGGWNYKSVIPVLANDTELTTEKLKRAFREDGMTVMKVNRLRESEKQLSEALNDARSSNTRLLSEILPSDGELLLTNWENGELPTEELMPGLGNAYRAFLIRK